MSDYLITGKKGNGKTIFAVGVILDALREGKRVATNLDLHLHKVDPRWRVNYYRLPDVPTIADFEAIGRGQDGVVEEDNGVICLDETSKILGARDWQGKGRSEVLDWLVHSRKLGWDVYMIAQGASQIDKMLRSSLLEYHIQVVRTDKWKLPIIGNFGKLLGRKPFCFPRMHIGTIRQGFQQGALVVDRKYYRGSPLYHVYDTQQLFLESDHPKAVALHSVLSPWATHGRYLPPRPSSVSEFIGQAWDGFINAAPERLPVAPVAKNPLVTLLLKLPPEQRLLHWKRLDSLGAFDVPHDRWVSVFAKASYFAHSSASNNIVQLHEQARAVLTSRKAGRAVRA